MQLSDVKSTESKPLCLCKYEMLIFPPRLHLKTEYGHSQTEKQIPLYEKSVICCHLPLWIVYLHWIHQTLLIPMLKLDES